MSRPETLPARLPTGLCLLEETPSDDRSCWEWKVRLVGYPAERGLPLYEYGDDILVRMRKEGSRLERRRFIVRVPGRKPAEEAGDDLQELLDRVLTKDALLKYADHIVDRYASRLRTKILRGAGLYSYALSL